MVLDLSRLLRQSLESPPHMGTLGEELSRVELFLRIEKSRFEDELSVTLDVAPALCELPCMPLLLQPLVENAIKHGMAPRGAPLGVEMTAAHREGRLVVRVTNDGLLHPAGRATAEGGGLGLRATRYRLEREYGAAGRLELAGESTPAGHRVSAIVAWPVPQQEGSTSAVSG
jgi:LytS/YehU family sensor histidine kinase